jgi:branched-chain amino acid transport system permease protein
MDLRRRAAELEARAAAWAQSARKASSQAMGMAATGLASFTALAQSGCASAARSIGRVAASLGSVAAQQASLLQLRWKRALSVSVPAVRDRLGAWHRAAIEARVVENAKRRLAAAIDSLGKASASIAQSAGPALAAARERWDAVRAQIGAAAVSGRERIAATLRDSPLAPALARLERWRPARSMSPVEGRYRVDVATEGSRCAALGVAFLLVLLLALPAFAERDLINDLIFMFTMLALAQHWNLLAGYAGLVSIGQQAFVGLGAYLLFALTIHAGIDPLLAILVAGLLAGLLALPTALVVFRLQGAYFAIGTWVMAEVYRLVFAQFRQLGGGTGTSLPSFVTNEVAGIGWVKALFGVRTSAARDIITYWVALLLAACTILAVYLVLRSRHGLALAAIRDSESAAESVGVDSFRTKLYVYVGTAVGTGMVGALIYLQKASISPDAAFSVLDWTAYVIFIVVIGGIGTIEGPIVGVLVFYLLQTNLAHFGSWYLILLGLLAIVTMLFAPKGIWGYLAERNAPAVFPLRRWLSENGTARMPHGRDDATLSEAPGPPDLR